MKFFQLVASLAFAASAAAQTFQIAVPTTGTALTLGQSFTVEVDQPVAQGVFQSVSAIIGLQACGASPCTPSNNEIMGDILYEGDYTPQRHENFKPPYQNFTFTAPSGMQSGHGVIHVAQLFLIGAGPTAQLAVKNVSVTLGQPTSAKFRL